MAVDISGGSLEFSAKIDINDFEGSIKRMDQGFEEAAKKAIDTADRAQKAFNEAFFPEFKVETRSLDDLMKKILELEKLEQRFTTGISGTQDPALLQSYQTGLEEVRGQLNLFYQELDAYQAKAAEQGGEAAGGNTEKVVTALTELRRLRNDLASGDLNADQFQEVFERAAALDDKIRDVNASLKLAGSDTKVFDAMTQGLRGVIGGFAALQGVVGLVSGENEELQRTTGLVVNAMGILNGVQELAAVLSKDSALNQLLLHTYQKLTVGSTVAQTGATTALAGATTAQAAATTVATGAQARLNAMMAANPVGALLLALTAVVTAIQYFSSNAEDAAEKQEELNKALEEANKSLVELAKVYNRFNEESTREAERKVTLAVAERKSQEEIFELKQEALQKSRDENKTLLSTLGFTEKSLELELAKLEKLNESIVEIQNIRKETGKLTEENEKNLGTLMQQKTALEALVFPARQAVEAIKKSNVDLEALRLANAKKTEDDALKSQAAAADARLSLAKKNTAEEYAATAAAIRANTKLELNNADLTSGERQRILAQEKADLRALNQRFALLRLQDDKAEVTRRLAQVKEGSAQELQLRLSLIQKETAIELAQEGITAKKRASIKAVAAKQAAELTKQYNQQLIQDEASANLASINARLVMAREGTAEELDLRKSLLDQQAVLETAAANAQIKNEKLLQARLIEIAKQNYAAKARLDADYAKTQLENRLSAIDLETEFRNLRPQGVIGDATSTAYEKNIAQFQVLQNSIDATKAKIIALDVSMLSGAKEVNEYYKQRAQLVLQLIGLGQQQQNQETKTAKELLAEENAQLDSIIANFTSLAGAASEFNEELGASLGLLASMLQGIQNARKAFEAYKQAEGKKDVLGQIAAGAGIASAVVGVVSAVVNLAKQAKQSREEAKKALDDFQAQAIRGEIQITQEYRDRAREQAKLNKLTLERIAAERSLLKDQKKASSDQYAALLKQIQGENFVAGLSAQKKNTSVFNILFGKTKVKEELQSLAGKSFEELEALFAKGQLTGKAKELFEQLQKIKQEGADIDKMLEENTEAAREVFTGTTSDSILDSIVDGFRNGLRSAQDFASSFEDLMRNAVLNALKYQTLEGPLQEFYKQFALDAESGGGLSEEEIKKLRETYFGIIDKAGVQFDELQKVTNLSFNAQGGGGNGLQGAIKGMTEQTGELIAGQFGGLRMTAVDQVNLARQALTHYRAIELNTGLTAARVLQMVEVIKSYDNGHGKLRVDM